MPRPMCDVLLLRASTRVDIRGTVRDTRVTSCFRGGVVAFGSTPRSLPPALSAGLRSVCVCSVRVCTYKRRARYVWISRGASRRPTRWALFVLSRGVRRQRRGRRRLRRVIIPPTQVSATTSLLSNAPSPPSSSSPVAAAPE